MYYYIINPAAGGGAINQLQDKLRARLNQLGIGGEFAKTTGPGEATKMAQQAIARGSTTIVAVGGDGLVNEVINGITQANIALGIIPIGHSNMLAQRLGIHNWQQACEVLAARRLTSFNLMAAGQHFFLSTLTLGFETDLDKQVDPDETNSWKQRLAKFSAGWSQARDYDTLTAEIRVDDSYNLTCKLFTLSVSNQKFTNPLTANRLVVSIADQPSRRQLTQLLWGRLSGKRVIEDTATTRFLAQKLLVKTNPPTGIMIDGKLAGRTPIAIRLTDRQVRFICEKPQSSFKAASPKLDLRD